MFKIKGQTKRRDLDFIDKDKNIIDKVSDFTAFVYPKGYTFPNVSEYHYIRYKNTWEFSNVITWETYRAAKRMLIS